MHILIVDDNKIAVTDLQAALLDSGHEVETARNGKDAMAVLRKASCNLVITDWEMPEMNGIQLCQAIRQEGFPGYIYIILLSAHGSPDERVQGLSAGADDFIAKPFNPAELLARVGIAERILSLETRDIAIFAMAKLAESRDPETGAHLERVRTYSRLLAQHLATVEKFREQVDAEFIRLIYMTSPLHDIGKVGVPDSVLLKSGRLDDHEFEIMKTHVMIGAETLDSTLRTFPGAKFLQMARDIAGTHHERWDGKGYPAGLAGEQIPLCGRIVALADVYDALTSKRVYKSAFSHHIARSIIVKEAGAQFDADVVDAFIHTEVRFIAVATQFADSSAAAA